MALDLGCGAGHIAKQLQGHGGIKTLHGVDSAEALLYRDDLSDVEVEYRPMVADLEQRLPYADNTFDIVLSSMALHWLNDLPGVLREVQRVLKPDSPFLAVMPGESTLYELRCVACATNPPPFDNLLITQCVVCAAVYHAFTRPNHRGAAARRLWLRKQNVTGA